ncbi:MAG: hypothetical protein RIE53_02055 [Rhodothermales bacterium]
MKALTCIVLISLLPSVTAAQDTVPIPMATSNGEEIIEETLQFIKEGGTTIGTASSATRKSYVTRRGDLIWNFGWTGVGAMEFARIRIGTVKYSTCDLIWDTEQLRGTDGFGNPIPAQ